MSETITIGNYTVSEEDIDAFIASLPQEQQMYRAVPQFREQVKDRLVEISLYAMYAKECKLDEQDSYKNAMMNAERDIAGQLAVASVVEKVTVTEEEAKAYFGEHAAQFAKGPSATASHILVDDENKANEIKGEIEAGGKTFEAAAKEYSSCPSKERGGSLGTFGRGQMVPEFDEAVFNGELNTILGPVKTQFGYHLIRIDSREDGAEPDFDSAKEQVRSTLLRSKQQAAYDEKVAELKERYMK